MTSYPRYLAFPFRVGADGRSAQPSGLPEHVRDELIQLLLSATGERLFLPEFGTPLRRMVFEAVDETLLGLTKAGIAQALQRWLGQRLATERLEVTFADGMLTVDLQYRLQGEGAARQISFQRRLA